MSHLGHCHRCGVPLYHDSQWVSTDKLYCYPCYDVLRKQRESQPETQEHNQTFFFRVHLDQPHA